MIISDLINNIEKMGHKLPYEKKISQYKEVLNLTHGKEDEYAYEILFAWYRILYEASHNDHTEEEIVAAKKCLELLDPTIKAGAIFDFDEQGQFYKEVIRCATNSLAWNAFKNIESKRELEHALQLINLGCNYSDGPQHFYLCDTKVRLLMKMKRVEEAYQIVYDCLNVDKSFSDFQSFKKDKEYQAWVTDIKEDLIDMDPDEAKFLRMAKRIQNGILKKIDQESKSVQSFEELIPEKEMITFKTGKVRYRLSGDNNPEDLVLVFKGDVHIDGSLDYEWLTRQLDTMEWSGSVCGVVVDGNLVVNGDIIDGDFESTQLYVIKNLTCDYLFTCYGTQVINGDAHVKYGIFGESNGGMLEIFGKLNTPYIICDDEHYMPESGEGEFIFIEGGNSTEKSEVRIGQNREDGHWYFFDDPTHLLVSEVWSDDEEFSIENFFAIVRKGKSPFVEIK